MEQQQIPTKSNGETDLPKALIAIFVIVLTLILFALYRRSKQVRRGFLLTGLSDTGKTLLYSRLVHKKFVNTQTSIKVNIGEYIINNNLLRVIDIPGHERLRYKYFDEYKSTARAVAYVIDSVTIQKDIRDVAEFLYNILTDPVIVSNSSPIVIICNKQDLPLAKGCNAVKTILEKELNTLRITKSNQLDSVDPKSKKASFLGKQDKEFDFSSLSIKVEFIETNIYSEEKKISFNIDDLQKLLIKIA